jgi:hypothetical protein
MKKTTLFLFALIALLGIVTQHASAGSAVAIEPRHGKMVKLLRAPGSDGY